MSNSTNIIYKIEEHNTQIETLKQTLANKLQEEKRYEIREVDVCSQYLIWVVVPTYLPLIETITLDNKGSFTFHLDNESFIPNAQNIYGIDIKQDKAWLKLVDILLN
jgi:hypothetical protein